MKKIIYTFVITTLLLGCEKDFLNRKPLDRISSEAVFNDPALLEAYLYQNYNYIPHGYEFLSYSRNPDTPDPGTEQVGYDDQGAYMIDCLSDVLTNKSGWPTSNSVIVPGHMSSSTDLPGLDTWERDYKAIRISNLIIENLKTSDFEQDITNRYSGEARFIRAFMYFDLARRFGGVPLITKSVGIDDMNSILVPKEPIENIYTFIDEELTEAANFLPSAKILPADELGRATQEACWALNGRAQLFAENWSQSAEMSRLVIESGNFILSGDYNALFQSHGGDKEVIFEILFNGAEKGHSLDRMALPFSERSDWGSQFLPTQEMVDSYEMTNGLPITDPGSGYDPEDPFINRDSRFASSVLYHGNKFKDDTIWVALSSNTSILPNDIDAPNLTGNHTTTGYYLKKFLDETLPFGPEFGVSLTSWKEIRFAEVLLNYAEAQNEAVGPDASVYEAINQVRERANQPDLPSGLSKEEMFDRIVNERKVELFAEGFRYWDLRRWKMAIDVLHGKKVHGLFITKDANNPDNLTYEVVEAINRPTYIFLERDYLLPIPQDEIDKNPNLIQNPGY
jgi:starch-binding outer membrane protein, SusD/RagB family